jgi:peptidoglycan/LPS O-acetylase OafA/YrhL
MSELATLRSTVAEEHPRAFRPDVQALRALAVALVVWYHADLPGFHGGFLGVDVFFVISGFVITGVLLQERHQKGSISLVDFYGRRIRRILPAATLVLVLTLFAVYHYLGFVAGDQNAVDAKWVAAFVGNVHFAATGTQYLNSTLPPSAYQQYWSLAVEEQFYLVWPLLFLTLTAFLPKTPSRIKLLGALVVIMCVSIYWCIVETSRNEIWAFFSPLTRAWELALGALLAVLVPVLRDRAKRLGTALGIVGVVIILASAWTIKPSTPWPGSAALVPVFATGLVIAGGTLRQSSGFGVVANFVPVQWLGNISYSLYLVHWPILIIAEQYSISGTLPLRSEVGLVALSLAVSAVIYYAVENPIRRSRLLKRNRVLTYLMGAGLIGISYAAIYWHLHNVST